MLVLAAAAWVGGLAGVAAPALRGTPGVVVAALLVGFLLVAAAATLGSGWSLRRRWAHTALGALVVLVAVGVVGGARVRAIATDPVRALATQRATVTAELVVTSDPRVRPGRFDDYVFFRARVEVVSGRGRTVDVRMPVLVFADPRWRDARLGSRLLASGRLEPAPDPGLAAVLSVRGPPTLVAAPDRWWRVAERVRASLRSAVEDRPRDQRALVPALVVGDDADMDPDLVDDVQVTGLTHLTAVSGTNLTLVVGFVLLLARWLGVRGRGRPLAALAGIAGFLLLARAEPSVVRAAAMGTVALAGLGAGGARRGTRALGVAVVCLLLVDPWLATSVGFALSALATAGILLLAPGWRDAVASWFPRWLPRWTAEAVAVPMAAQVACTPVVAAISGQVSLVAVVANLLVAPVVGPATVLGLAAGLAGLVWQPAGTLLGTLASWCVGWIVVVARYAARLPGAAVDWDAAPGAIVLLTLACLGLVAVMPRLLGRPATGLACVGLLVVTVLVGPVRPGWPPRGWVLTACDVGQGDALVLRVRDGEAIVFDAGPDPGAVGACLRRLDVEKVPMLVLTHFHADHVDGLDGVLDGRAVGEVLVSPLPDPPTGAAQVQDALADAGVPARVPAYGEVLEVGPVRMQVLWPPARAPAPAEGSPANNASLVLLVRVAGLSLLLTGDIEPAAQRGLARTLQGVHVDVLKLPHHGSAAQEPAFLTGLQPKVVLVCVGADNDYGHPAPEALAPFEQTGTTLLRTDLGGDLVVVARDGAIATVTSR